MGLNPDSCVGKGERDKGNEGICEVMFIIIKNKNKKESKLVRRKVRT